MILFIIYSGAWFYSALFIYKKGISSAERLATAPTHEHTEAQRATLGTGLARTGTNTGTPKKNFKTPTRFAQKSRTTLGTGLARTGTNTAKRIFTQYSARRRRRNRSRNAGGVVRRCAMGLLEPPAVLRSLQKSFSSIRVAGSDRVKPLARPAACRRRPVCCLE